MSKHTEGPWNYAQDRRGWWRVFAGDSEIVRALSKHGLRRLSKSERAANARLIAAAPDLLEALEELYWLATDNERMGVHMPEYDRAQAAKAKGEGQ